MREKLRQELNHEESVASIHKGLRPAARESRAGSGRSVDPPVHGEDPALISWAEENSDLGAIALEDSSHMEDPLEEDDSAIVDEIILEPEDEREKDVWSSLGVLSADPKLSTLHCTLVHCLSV
jgi:hypothetical protein